MKLIQYIIIYGFSYTKPGIKKDFIYKLCVVIKELGERYVCRCIIEVTTLVRTDDNQYKLKKENDKLVAFFTNSN